LVYEMTGPLKASRFERDHQMLIRLALVGAAWLTYLVDRDDVVWRVVKDAGTLSRAFEHAAFAMAGILIGLGASFCTIARRVGLNVRASREAGSVTQITPAVEYAGEFLYAVGLASLVPLAGSILLVAGEGTRLLRLTWSDRRRWASEGLPARSARAPARMPTLQASTVQSSTVTWRAAIRREVARWGIFLSMIVFAITLRDRQVELLIGVSVLLAVLANWRAIRDCRRGVTP
jgi:hypothetical protein